MSIDVIQAHYGFSRTPFGRDLAPGMLHRSAGHGEAVARIAWCIGERALGVITGEVGLQQSLPPDFRRSEAGPTRAASAVVQRIVSVLARRPTRVGSTGNWNCQALHG